MDVGNNSGSAPYLPSQVWNRLGWLCSIASREGACGGACGCRRADAPVKSGMSWLNSFALLVCWNSSGASPTSRSKLFAMWTPTLSRVPVFTVSGRPILYGNCHRANIVDYPKLSFGEAKKHFVWKLLLNQKSMFSRGGPPGLAATPPVSLLLLSSFDAPLRPYSCSSC